MNKLLRIWVVLLLLQSCTGQPQVQTTIMEPVVSRSDTALRTFKIPAHDSLFIDSVLQSIPFFKDQSARVAAFYAARQNRVAWFNQEGVAEQTGEVVNLIRDYLEAGIVDSSVFMKGIGALYDTLSAPGYDVASHLKEVMAADILFTGQFFAFSDRAWRGKYIDRRRELEWFLPANQLSPVAYLDSLLQKPAVAIRGSEPVFRQYTALQKKLSELVAVQKNGGWMTVAVPPKALALGDSTPETAAIRTRLGIQGSGDPVHGMVYDSAVFKAVRSFQECHGLPATGVTDRRTIEELNVPVEKRIRLLLLNLERWKWVPADPGGDFIAVNIPEFMLHVYENGTEAWNMKVIVGKNASRTVIFSGDLKYVVLAPYWNVPRSIVINEILPAAKRNKGYLASHRMEVVSGNKVIPPSAIHWNNYSAKNFPYNIRQKPGSHNSLGLVKFLFPNSYAIYLHDTPSKWLFEKEERDFSHGCIRLSEPAKLAEYLLRDNPDWNREKIKKAMHGNKEQTVTVRKPIPVYITYFTCWVDASGRLNFRDDVYGHDRKLDEMMFGERGNQGGS